MKIVVLVDVLVLILVVLVDIKTPAPFQVTFRLPLKQQNDFKELISL